MKVPTKKHSTHIKNCEVMEGQEGDEQQEGVEQELEQQKQRQEEQRRQEEQEEQEEQRRQEEQEEQEEQQRQEEWRQEEWRQEEWRQESPGWQEQEEQRRHEVTLTFAALGMSSDMPTLGPQAPTPVLVTSIDQGEASHTTPPTLTHIETLTPALMQQDLQLDIVSQSVNFSYDSLDDMFG